jgi:hypothetical protein
LKVVTLDRLILHCRDLEISSIIFMTLLYVIQHFALLSESQILRSRIGQIDLLRFSTKGNCSTSQVGALVDGTRDAKVRSLVPRSE